MKSNSVFYSKGLQFECTGCGRCCTGAPGFVYLSESDIERISNFLKMDKITFIKKYTFQVTVYGENRLSLKEKSNYDCIFYRDKKCLIYPVRPYQCRSYPFWKNNIKSRDRWERLSRDCPGIGRGKVYTKEEIEEIAFNVPDYDISRFRIIRDG